MITSRLSSDILEEQFGPTTIKILYQDDTTRIIQTIAEETDQILELSLVRFIPEGVAAFPEIHHAVLSGQSMGKAFRAAGIEFRREARLACRHTVPTAMQKLFGNQEPATIVAVQIFAGPSRIPYATITETYAPEANWPDTFGKITTQTEANLNLLAGHLAH